ncbi:MAG TPA: NADH-quinone oxidoreductase subunit N [Acidimicrobiales bacterium]|nr:NADH-quinone oxidoreductase subunit N [Acidimicrobiales bacterium]
MIAAVHTLGLVAAASTFKAPYFDYNALMPEIVLTAVIVIVLIMDLVVDETHKYRVTQFAGLGVLGTIVPIIVLAAQGISGHPRSMFGGAYVVDVFSLVVKALFLGTAYVVLLMSTNYIEEGDYHEGEFSFLVLCSLLGMLVMASSRDLITIFIALELLSIPAYLLAGWRKRDLKSNEASLKYYLLGVLATGVMLYGMSLIFGATGTTLLTGISAKLNVASNVKPLVVVGIFFIVVGFAFKVSAVPFHFWAPDTYEGAPTPITAFLSVASKTAGFVALLELIYVGFLGRHDVWEPLFWILAVLTMTVGNLVALRQTNIVRLLAYSSIAQAGYILVPFAVAGDNQRSQHSALTASLVYLLLYAAMNLGAFAVVIAVARKTRSGEVASYGGLFTYAPGLTLMMTAFVFSLAGIPPFGGWFAKFYIIRSVLDSATPAAIALGVIVAVNSVIALYYYAGIARLMWMSPVPDEDRTPIRVPAPLATSIGLCGVVVVVLGVYPQAFARLGDLAQLTH